jgi:hypothetical protein
MSQTRGRGRPTKFTVEFIDRVRTLRSDKKSYSAIATELSVTKRTLLNWRARGEAERSGRYYELFLALGGVTNVKLMRPSPRPIVAIEWATIRTIDGSRRDSDITLEEIQGLRAKSDVRYTTMHAPAKRPISVQVCTPRPEAALTERESELFRGLVHLMAREPLNQVLLIEFQPE